MVQQNEMILPQGSLYYEIHIKGGRGNADSHDRTHLGGRVVITGTSGPVSEVVIPETLDGYPVTEIGKKAFLSRKHLRKVCLPHTIEELGDWAFAYCSNLEQVVLPGKEVKLGKALFLECGKLKKLEITKPEMAEAPETLHQTAELLAAAVTVFDSYYLLDLLHAGSEEWIGKWDARLKTYLHADDHEGYSRQVLCGEEDYGSTDLEAFLKNKRKGKVRMCYLRLLNPPGLLAVLKEELIRYLLDHEEAWEVLLQEYGHERRYYELFAEIGCLTEENMDEILHDIGEEYTEMKAYFLRYKEEQIGYTDFFDGLSLDL